TTAPRLPCWDGSNRSSVENVEDKLSPTDSPRWPAGKRSIRQSPEQPVMSQVPELDMEGRDGCSPCRPDTGTGSGAASCRVRRRSICATGGPVTVRPARSPPGHTGAAARPVAVPRAGGAAAGVHLDLAHEPDARGRCWRPWPVHLVPSLDAVRGRTPDLAL